MFNKTNKWINDWGYAWEETESFFFCMSLLHFISSSMWRSLSHWHLFSQSRQSLIRRRLLLRLLCSGLYFFFSYLDTWTVKWEWWKVSQVQQWLIAHRRHIWVHVDFRRKKYTHTLTWIVRFTSEAKKKKNHSLIQGCLVLQIGLCRSSYIISAASVPHLTGPSLASNIFL